MESILVTGGAGFIGSHTCLSLIKKGYSLYILDSFINSSELALINVVKILEIENFDTKDLINIVSGDIKDKSIIRSVFLKSIKDKKCHCTHNCAMVTSILYNEKKWPKLIYQKKPQ